MLMPIAFQYFSSAYDVIYIHISNQNQSVWWPFAALHYEQLIYCPQWTRIKTYQCVTVSHLQKKYHQYLYNSLSVCGHIWPVGKKGYFKTYDIRCTLVGIKIVGHSDVVGALLIGAAPTISSFSTQHMASIYCIKTTATWDEKHLRFSIWCLILETWLYLKSL